MDPLGIDPEIISRIIPPEFGCTLTLNKIQSEIVPLQQAPALVTEGLVHTAVVDDTKLTLKVGVEILQGDWAKTDNAFIIIMNTMIPHLFFITKKCNSQF